MNTAAIVTGLTAATAFLVALGHVLADISGVMDRFRKTPIQPPAGPPAAPPAGTSTQPPGAPSGL